MKTYDQPIKKTGTGTNDDAFKKNVPLSSTRQKKVLTLRQLHLDKQVVKIV